jgi:hypothetical protein
LAEENLVLNLELSSTFGVTVLKRVILKRKKKRFQNLVNKKKYETLTIFLQFLYNPNNFYFYFLKNKK